MRHPALLPLTTERAGSHLTVCLSASPETDSPPIERVIHLLRHGHGTNEWSGWFTSAAAEAELARHREVVNANRGGGAVVFLADEFATAVVLPGPVRDRVIGGSCFHLKPLLAALQSEHPFQLLTLSRRRAQLFRGSARGLEPLRLPELPEGVDDPALAQQHGKSHTLHTIGRTHGGGVEAAFHGHSNAASDRKHDLDRYVRRVESVVSSALRGQSSPLVLAAVDEVLALYRRVNSYPHLLPGGVTGSPDHCSAEQLYGSAWPLVAENAPHPEQGVLREYRELHGTGRTADAIAEVVAAAADGQVGTLLISPDIDVWGTFDSGGRRVTTHPTREPGDDELTNAAAVHVLRHGGTVYTVSPADLAGRPAVALRWLPQDKHGKGGPS